MSLTLEKKKNNQRERKYYQLRVPAPSTLTTCLQTVHFKMIKNLMQPRKSFFFFSEQYLSYRCHIGLHHLCHRLFTKSQCPSLLPAYRNLSYGSAGKESACNTGDRVSIPETGRSPGEGNGNLLQYSCLKKIPWTEKPGRLQSMGSQRVGHD